MAVEIYNILFGINTEIIIDSVCCYLKLVDSTYFFRMLVKSACFAMIIIRNYYQSLRFPRFPESLT